MPDAIGPLFGQDAADLGRALVSASVEGDINIVREALSAIWVEQVIDHWLVRRNAHLRGATPIDLLHANELERVMSVVRDEIQGAADGASAQLNVGQ